ncbi:MAG: tetratricopeptide (TPR) repeat protein [Candidatus Azotimanducaceae bacterium]|jgi:tetratricopeptide (TPR) repeat protein
MLQMDRRSVDAHLAFAELYQVSGQHEAANREYLETLKLDENNPGANIGLAELLVIEGGLRRAGALFETAVRTYLTYWKVQKALGSYYSRSGMYHRAMESYLRVTKLMGGNTTVFNNLGAARLYVGDFDGAYESWQQANQLEPSSAVRSNMVSALYYGSRIEEALQQSEAALVLDPGEHRLWGDKGDALTLIAGKQAKMRAAYFHTIQLAEALVDVNSDDATTLSRLAVYTAAVGRDQEARVTIDRARGLAALDINVLYDAARTWRFLGHVDESVSYGKQALDAVYPLILLESDPQLYTETKKENNNDKNNIRFHAFVRDAAG